MLQQLQLYYGEDFITGFDPDRKDHYKWFQTSSGERFGIQKSRLSEKEEQLLVALFANEISGCIPFSGGSVTEKAWYNYLTGKEHPLPPDTLPVRFIYAEFSDSMDDKGSFGEAVNGFMEEAPIVWLTSQAAVIVEKAPSGLMDMESITALSSSLLSDLYIEPAFFIGQIHDSNERLKDKFLAEREIFNELYSSSSKGRAATFYEACPLFLTGNRYPLLRNAISDRLLDTLKEDELISTLKVFFSSNLNVSSASKALYMHRNSLQYRIDRFIERTGIDVKYFANALAVYLLILYMENPLSPVK
ncbi:helix-turn-helix domain-containing protein [Metabacillus sp. 84]|uniref:helix-turn-helix domain-containing protein n=1 Tax=unclassified Metabacillus TaxID=2675274 RepID=UPI003CF6A703